MKYLVGIFSTVAGGIVIGEVAKSGVDTVLAQPEYYMPFVPLIVAIIIIISLGFYGSRAG